MAAFYLRFLAFWGLALGVCAKPIVAVVGATGAQGGAVVDSLLADGTFTVRALTRDPNSAKAQQLAAAGCEVVQADLDSLESLKAAFSGASGAFFLTNYWEHFSPEKEVQQLKNMADAAKSVGVAHAVWTTLEDTRLLVADRDDFPTLQGKYKVPHYDGKGEADKYLAEIGLPHTNLLTSFYWQNFISFGMGPQPGPDGKLKITFPIGQAAIPLVDVADIGHSVTRILRNPETFIGLTTGVSSLHLTGNQMAAAFSRVLGLEISFYAPSRDEYAGYGFPGADDLASMFHVKNVFEKRFRESRPPHGDGSGLQKFEAWIAANKDALLPKNKEEL